MICDDITQLNYSPHLACCFQRKSPLILWTWTWMNTHFTSLLYFHPRFISFLPWLLSRFLFSSHAVLKDVFMSFTYVKAQISNWEKYFTTWKSPAFKTVLKWKYQQVKADVVQWRVPFQCFSSLSFPFFKRETKTEKENTHNQFNINY